VAAYIEGGASLGEALEKVPRFLPPQINAILRAGEKIGDLKKVLPAAVKSCASRRHRAHHDALYGGHFAAVRAGHHLDDLPHLGDGHSQVQEVASATNVQLWPLTTFVFGNTLWLVTYEAVLFIMLVAAVMITSADRVSSVGFNFAAFPS